MTEAAIVIDKVEKTYAGGKQALKGVSFDVPRGSIFGLLGPNGAGKSTLINILAGLVTKTGGQASIWGFDIDAHPRNAKNSIGIVPQEIVFDPFFTPFETLENAAGLYGVKKGQRRSMELLKAVHLEDKAHAYARTLSGGMKRRLLRWCGVMGRWSCVPASAWWGRHLMRMMLSRQPSWCWLGRPTAFSRLRCLAPGFMVWRADAV